MRVLVFGRSGQLASELWRAAWPPSLVVSSSAVDVTDAARVQGAINESAPDLVVNSGAYTAVDRAETEPQLARAVNALGPELIAQACERRGAALIHVSTDYVFDGTKQGAYSEDDPTAPIGVYGRSKAEGEQRIASSLARHIIVRTSWVFSAHGHNFVKTMLRLARERDELRVVADQIGRPTAARDLAGAIVNISTKIAAGDSAPWGIYHFAGTGTTSWHGFAEAIVGAQLQSTGRAPRVVPISTADYPTPAKRPANSVLDTQRYESAFGAAPRPWHAGLAEVVAEVASPGSERPT